MANRARLPLEVTEAVTKVWGADRVGIRFSPGGVFNDMHDSNPLATFSYVLRELNRVPPRLCTPHRVHGRRFAARRGACAPCGTSAGVPWAVDCRNGFNSRNRDTGRDGRVADAVAFGRLFLANPDLPERFRLNSPLNSPNESTFYGGSEKGYTDYPALASQMVHG